MKEENLITDYTESNQKHTSFDKLWEIDIDTLYEEYGLNSDLDQDENSLEEQNWLIF